MNLNRQSLFFGMLINWNALTQSERVVGTIIILIPLWWLLGWRNLFILLGISLTIYDFYNYGKLHLKSPSVSVISIITFGLYTIISTYFYSEYNNERIGPNLIVWPIDAWIGFGLILWYVQSKNIRVRLEVVAWSFSVIVALMLLFWLVIYFVWHQSVYIPPRSLYGLITNKGEEYVIGAGNDNYLMPYSPTDESFLGMVRYVFFFPGPESLALVVGFISLLSLDIKNRLWSVMLFSSSIFLLLLSGTRSVWLALPFVFCLRYLLITGKAAGTWFICGFIATFSFVTLSLPPVTNLVYSITHNTAQATSNFRADSSETRAEIYRRTFQAITESPDVNLLFGHVVNGELLVPGYATAKIGSHSFLLGGLFYRAGLLGTGIFLTYWLSLILWLYNTRIDRPLCSVLMFLVFSLTFSTMEIELPVMPLSLICVILRISIARPNSTYAQAF